MSYGRIKEVEPKLEAEVSELLRQAEAVDRVEDEEHGRKARGDELPEELQRREAGSALPAEGRLAKIREAKARLEERARVRTEEVLLAKGVDADVAKAAGQSAEPRDKEQSNFTDPDSRIMKTKAGWVQGYNAQVMVEASSGVIVAEEVGNHSADSPRLIPMLDATEANLKAIGVSIQPNSDQPNSDQPNSNGKSSAGTEVPA